MGKRSLIPALTLAASAIALTGTDAGAQTTLRMMHQGDPEYVSAYQDAARRFTEANPDIRVELVYTPHDAYNERVGAAVLSGNLPDIMEVDAPFVSNYAWSGILRPLGDLIDQALLDDMTPSNVAQGTYPIDDQLYAIGLVDSSVLLYGNRRFLEEAGIRIPTGLDDAWSREEFEDALRTLSGIDGVQWPIDLFRSYGSRSEWLTYAYSPILQSFGCDLIDRETWEASGTLDSEPCVEAAAMMQDWFQKGWVVPQSAGGNQFYAEGGKVGLAWGGHWFWQEASTQLGDDLVIMPLPRFGEKAVSPNGTWIWGITQNSEHPEGAARFLQFMLTDEAVREVSRQNAALPGLHSFEAESPLYAEGGPMRIAAEQSEETALPRPQHPAYPTITLATMMAFDAIFNGADPQTALTRAARTIDEDIDDNDGYYPFGE